jgi:hypothetical protein
VSPKRRKYCCLTHQRDFINWRWLKRAFEEGRLSGWRVSLLENLERLMKREREKVAQELGISVDELVRMIEAQDANKEGGEAK